MLYSTDIIDIRGSRLPIKCLYTTIMNETISPLDCNFIIYQDPKHEFI